MRTWISSMFLLAVIGAAQAPSVPTFRTGTKLVQVEVIARDKKGPAAGLTKEDFKLFDSGKPQEIYLFSVTSPQTSGRTATPLPPGAISNRLTGGESPATTTVVLLDRINTRASDQVSANERVAKFLETRRTQDRFGIYTLGESVNVIQDLTSDRDLLSRAAQSLKTQKTLGRRDSDTTGMSERAATEYALLELTSRARDFKHALEAIARHLASVPGRKNLIWVTGSFLLASPPPYKDFDFTPDMEEAARALNDANVALYAVDARGLAGALSGGTGVANAESAGGQGPSPIIQMRAKMGTGPTGVDTMNVLSGLTGGLVFINTNGVEDSMKAAVRDSELTYTLGFYPSQESQDGIWHKLKVDVDRRGVNLRYRETYFASKTLADASERPTLDQLLKDSLDATQVELFAETTPDQDHPGSYQVRVCVDPHGVQLDHRDASWLGTLAVAFFVEGSKTRQTITKKIEIPDNQLAASLEKGIVVESSIALDGPSGVLRIVVQDQATGAAGSIRIPMGRR